LKNRLRHGKVCSRYCVARGEAEAMGRENHQMKPAQVVRCGVYEVDLAVRELRRNGLKVSLQEQPFRVLIRLLAQPGQLVTRQELQQELWGPDCLVDPDLGLNTAIKKLRMAFRDPADNPRFIETLPKRGYRFIAPAQDLGQAAPVVSTTTGFPASSKDDAVTKPPPEEAHFGEAYRDGSSNEDHSPSAALATAEKPFVEPRAGQRQALASGLTQERGNPALGFLARLAAICPAFRLLLPVVIAIGASGDVSHEKFHVLYQSTVGIGGYDLKSPLDRAVAFDYDHSGKKDHLLLYRPGPGVVWIVRNSEGNFGPIYEGDGIAGCDIGTDRDRILAFDYAHSGRSDHLAIYRPGMGITCILSNAGDGIFTPVYRPLAGERAALPHDLGRSADQVLAFDYEHTGKLDHLVFYRPDAGITGIWTNRDGKWSPVLARFDHAGGMEVKDPQPGEDRALAFDYDHSGMLDHLVLYQPGRGTVTILKNSGGTFTPVYEGSGIGGYDLKSANDRILAFDYDHSGMLDHLLLYRPGTGTVSIFRHTGETFAPVFESRGIGRYDLKSANDRILAFDYDRSGKPDHLALFRPGTGIVHIVDRR
jgi:DNA-binding winged helix-turn-helix (wHTH) protein